MKENDIRKLIIEKNKSEMVVEWQTPNRKGICPKCFNFGGLQKHHIFPKRHFNKNGKILYLCNQCHSEIERILPKRKLSKYEYLEIHKAWMFSKAVLVK